MDVRMKHPVFVIPEALQALQALGKAVHKAGVAPETIELVHLRASQINGCSVCVEMHARDLRRPARAMSGSSPSPPGATRRTSPTPSAPPSHSARR